MLDNLRLPSYSKDASIKVEGRDRSCNECICSASFKDLVTKDEFGPFVPEEEGGEGVPLAGREDQLRKTPAVGAATGYAGTRSARLDFE